jgi:zinc/manganese transport system permease protein
MQWAYGVLVGCLASLVGLLASYWLDTSTGATIVCAFALILCIFLLGYVYQLHLRSPKKLWKPVFLSTMLFLSASFAWLGANPRADQPLFDSVERYVPSLRFAYFNPDQKLMYLDAQKYIARYTAELKRLGEMESRNRWELAETDDFLVQKISSFQQSYNEMIKGESFVMQEVRSRARQKLRWPAFVLAIGFLVIGIWVYRYRPRASP